jgi:2-haloacid dehalogenase
MNSDTGFDRRSFVVAVTLTALASAVPRIAASVTPSATVSRARSTVLVFDVADTLLNLDALTPLFARVFGDGNVANEWFGESILYAETMTVTRSFVPFGKIGEGVFRMFGKVRGATVTLADVEELVERFGELPSHADVAEGLDDLRTAGFRMVTLTNTPANGHALARAGIDKYFERHFSAEAVKQFKPSAETYQMVATQLGLSTSELCVVAAHPWDLIGAQTAGCSAVLLTRRGVAQLKVPGLRAPLAGSNLVDVARQLSAEPSA